MRIGWLIILFVFGVVVGLSICMACMHMDDLSNVITMIEGKAVKIPVLTLGVLVWGCALAGFILHSLLVLSGSDDDDYVMDEKCIQCLTNHKEE